MESHAVNMRIGGWDKKKFIWFYVLFFIILGIGLLIGGYGPYRYKQKEFTHDVQDAETSPIFYIEVKTLNRLNQFLFIDTHFYNGADIGIKENIDFDVWVWGTNDLTGASDKPNFTEESTVGISSGNSDSDEDTDDGWDLLEFSEHTREIDCDAQDNCTVHTLVYIPYFHHKNYFVKFQYDKEKAGEYFDNLYLDVYFVNKSMSYFEIFFRYFFVLGVLAWLFIITRATKGISFRSFTAEQKWIYILLILLLLFNNPLHPLNLLTNSGFVEVLDAIFSVTFIMALFAFWLTMIDRFRYENGQHSFLKFYLPKLLPLIIMWITFLTIYIYTRVHQFDDPQFETVNDVPGFLAAVVIYWIINVIVILWLFYVCIRAFIETKGKPEQRKSLNFFFSLFIITFIMILVTLIGNFIPALSNTAIEFVSYFVIVNLYICSLSIAYLPSSKILDDINEGAHTKLEDEDEDETASDYKKSPESDFEMKSEKSEESSNNSQSEKSEKSEKSEQSEKSSD